MLRIYTGQLWRGSGQAGRASASHIHTIESVISTSAIVALRINAILVYHRDATTNKAIVVNAIDGPRACHPIPRGATGLRLEVTLVLGSISPALRRFHCTLIAVGDYINK